MTETKQPDHRLRLFAAIELPDEWLRSLTKARTQLERDGGREFKWVRTELMHLTLVFLGSQEAPAVPEITRALRSAASSSSPFDLFLGRLGAFGPPHGISVLWAGLAQTPPGLQELHTAITRELALGNVEFDRKPLVPHVTIARGRRPPDREASLKVSAALKRTQLPPLNVRVDQFVLMRSRLSPSGPSYERMEHFALGAADDQV